MGKSSEKIDNETTYIRTGHPGRTIQLCKYWLDCQKQSARTGFLGVLANYISEQAGSIGVDDQGEEFFDLSPQLNESNVADLEAVINIHFQRNTI